MVVVDEIDGAERAVGLDFPDHTSYAVAVVGVVFGRHRIAVVACGDEFALFRHIPAHTLVHDGLEVFRHHARPCGFGHAVGHIVFGKQFHGCCPCVAIYRGLHHGFAWRLVLAARVGEVVHVELAVPVGHHGLVVVEPSCFAPHGLYAVNTHHRRQSAVVACRCGDGLAGIVHGISVVAYQVVDNVFRGHEHGAMLVSNGKFHAACAVFKSLEVLGAVSTVYFLAVGVVIDVIPAVNIGRGWAFAEHVGEGFRSLAPRAVGRFGKGHLDVALLAGVVFQHHHIVVVATLHHGGVDAAEPRLDEQFGLAECLEVFGGGVIQAVVIVVVFESVGEFARNARSPDYHVLPFHVVIKQFGSPHVDRGGVVHHGDEAFLCPVDEVFRRGVAKSFVTSPAGGPHQMEGAVGAFHDGWVAHHLLVAHLGGEECALDGIPVDAVVTVDETQSFVGWFMKRGGNIDVFCTGAC